MLTATSMTANSTLKNVSDSRIPKTLEARSPNPDS
jgi:hypothetical protein